MGDVTDELVDTAQHDELLTLAAVISVVWDALSPLVDRALELDALARRERDYFELARGEFFTADEEEAWRIASGHGAVQDALRQFLDNDEVDARMREADAALGRSTLAS